MKPTPLRRDEGFFDRVYEVVRAIPRGRVMTYGEVSQILGHPRGARVVGWALRALSRGRAGRVPWHRVLARGGVISLPGLAGARQRRCLEAEGVRLVSGRVDMKRYAALTRGPAVAPAPRRTGGRTSGK